MTIVLDPICILQDLCEVEPAAVSGQYLASARGGPHDILRVLGALVEAGKAKTVLCAACDEPHTLVVEHAGDGRY